MSQQGAWHARSEEVIEALQTDPERGLTTEEARRRLFQFGFNELAERPSPGFWRMLLDQFNNFLVLILIAAALISLTLGEMEEAIAIMAIVLLNAVLGVIQERRAEEALAALKKMAAPEARVLRDGHRVTIPARELVHGDIVFLEAGNYVPADLRLLETVNLRIVEALKAHGHIVAMTGDGVNDAPALKRADIGVAMSITGTDVTKEVADMVLTDDNYASIVAAIEQGRIIYSNIRKFVYFSCNVAEIITIFLATLAGYLPPLTPIQLLWLNLLTDGAPALALGIKGTRT